MSLHTSHLCCLLKGNRIWHSIIWEILKNIHCIYLYIYMYSWINPYIWRVELGLGRWHGAHSLLQYLAHNEFIVSVWLNQWMRIRGWKRILHTTFTCFLYHLLFNTMFNSLNFFTMFNCFIIQWRCVKMCSPLLRRCPSVRSVSSASEGSLPFSYSFPLSQMKGCPCAAIHSSLFWTCGFLILCILNTYHHKCSIPSCSAGSFFPAWWVRALSGMVRSI